MPQIAAQCRDEFETEEEQGCPYRSSGGFSRPGSLVINKFRLLGHAVPWGFLHSIHKSNDKGSYASPVAAGQYLKFLCIEEPKVQDYLNLVGPPAVIPTGQRMHHYL